MIRSVAWSPSSLWFVLATESGTLVFMDTDGKEFNRCDTGAPVWSMKLVNTSFFKQKEVPTAEEKSDDDEPEIVLNDIGVYGKSLDEQNKEKIQLLSEKKAEKEKKVKDDEKDEFKKNATAEEFIKNNKVDDERLMLVSWDQKYRVINPGSLAHTGQLVVQKRLFSGKKKKMQDKENPFLIAESRLPFIPLTFELIKQYVVVAGVGGKIVILNAETGAILLDLFQVQENDPFVVNAPKNSK